MKYYIYGEVTFNSTQKRNTAARRLDQRAAAEGFTPEAWHMLAVSFGSWPAGQESITKDGQPGIRFCYVTLSQTVADSAVNDITAAWDVFQDSSSWWGYVAQP